jgi:hypothetical protein
MKSAPKSNKNTTPVSDLRTILPPFVEGESMISQAVIHPAIYLKGGVFAVFALSVILMGAGMLGVFFLMIAAGLLGYAYLTKHFLLVVLTNKRVFLRYGILKLDVVEFRYSQIETIQTGTTILGQFLGYTSLMITGVGTQRVVIPFVLNARQIQYHFNQIALLKE